MAAGAAASAVLSAILTSLPAWVMCGACITCSSLRSALGKAKFGACAACHGPDGKGNQALGSANLTDSAWYKNVEAGCFFSENEITPEMSGDIEEMFKALNDHSTPLSDELRKELWLRKMALTKALPNSEQFWESGSFTKWPGLGQTKRIDAVGKRRASFLKEWYATLQDLRDIGSLVSQPSNQPVWIGNAAPSGAQADQFLHAHYYQRTFDGKKANYAGHYEANRQRRAEALLEAVQWWRNLPAAPDSESVMLNHTAPFLRQALSEEQVSAMTFERFRDICTGVHAIKDYARRVSNKSVNLPEIAGSYPVSQKVDAHSRRLWNDQGSSGGRVKELFSYVLYGGSQDQLPERLWLAVSDPKWKIDGLGISALGELIGWALPDSFPPRNGRTSKALRSLGYDVAVHVE